MAEPEAKVQVDLPPKKPGSPEVALAPVVPPDVHCPQTGLGCRRQTPCDLRSFPGSTGCWDWVEYQREMGRQGKK